jgi:AcrR family transcriptional regulator
MAHARGVAVAPQTESLAGPRLDAIRGAALDLVAESGFESVSMDAVAARAHASKATIYRHWTGKAALVVDALHWRGCGDLGIGDAGSLRADLQAVVADCAISLGGPEGGVLRGLMQACEHDPELAGLIRSQLYDSRRPMIVDLLGRAVARGELADTGGADRLHEVLPGVVFLRIMVLHEHPDEAWRDHVVDDILLPVLGIPSVPVPAAPTRTEESP